MVQTDATDYAVENTKEVVVELVQKDNELADSDGNDEIKESSFEKDEDNHDNVVPAVLRFHDIGYLEFDETTKVSIISQPLDNEMNTLGSGPFQQGDNLSSVPGEQ